jgi:hypothetical protein
MMALKVMYVEFNFRDQLNLTLSHTVKKYAGLRILSDSRAPEASR